MKLLRLKITDSNGFRSLPCGFEHHFRSEWNLHDELTRSEEFAPFVCAGPNGSGKSNLLEVLAAIFFQLEILRVRRSFLPEVLQSPDQDFSPVAFELDYLIRVPEDYQLPGGSLWADVGIRKTANESVQIHWQNQHEFSVEGQQGSYATILLPQYVLGYSSGENEILSLPFFKLRFVQFDEYWNALTKQLGYPGYPETRLAYLDNGFSQAILLCNLLFQDEATLQPFRQEVGIEALREFRIILKRSIEVPKQQASRLISDDEVDFVDNPAISFNEETGVYTVNLLHPLEGNERTSIIEKLKRCATLNYQDQATDTFILDYWVNEATKKAFRKNFDSPLALFQALQVLLSLNLYTVSNSLKSDIYRSTSHYVSETIPTLAADERIMRFKNFHFTKQGVEKNMLLKELSDGEHQLLHSLGLCLLFRGTNSLFLFDEPETHFNPAWRASFISSLRACLQGEYNIQVKQMTCLSSCTDSLQTLYLNASQEMLITTHSPFLISDSKQDKVLVFDKNADTHTVSITHPEYNTLGASINKITMTTFGKRETIGGHAQVLLDALRARFEQGEDISTLIDELDRELGDSVEKILLVKAMLDRGKTSREEGQG